uniref:Deleted in azoospermia-like n=1 Tax=Cyprinus carpio TaxID=7962 RepID=A0A8C1SCP5_CYPCA
MYEGAQLPLCLICGLYSQEFQKHRQGFPSSLKLSNGYILPEGKMTPNTLFVGGIDMKVMTLLLCFCGLACSNWYSTILNSTHYAIFFFFFLSNLSYSPNWYFFHQVDENEIREFFAKYGSVKEVKIITYRGGICKGYGFVYFGEDVDIQTIVDQQISFKGKKLKLGPAIMKERNSRSVSSPMIGPSQWISPSPYMYCSCCPPSLAPPSPVFNGGNQYMQPYSYSSPPGFIVPQVPMNYAQTTYAYQYPLPQWCGEQRTRLVNQNYVDCGVQTLLTLL